MRSADTLAAFQQHLRSRYGLAADGLGARTAIEAMLGFYAEERATGADLAAGEDMILFQWGTYDWGTGASFEYGIIRQLITEPDDASSEGIWQLQLTLHFRPDQDNARLRSGNRWLDVPAGLGEFATWIAAHPATAYSAAHHPIRTVLEWEPV